MSKIVENFFERFEHLIQPEPNTGCWLWRGGATTGRASVGVGYGIFHVGRANGRNVPQYAHRAAYEAIHGAGTADGLLVRHSCDMPLCVNPDHLSVGTHKDNAADMVGRGRSLRGERNSNARLSRFDVQKIIQMTREGDIPQSKIAAEFGIHQSAVSLIASGRRWAPFPSRPQNPNLPQASMTFESTRRSLIALSVKYGARSSVGVIANTLGNLVATPAAGPRHEARKAVIAARLAADLADRLERARA